MFVVGHFEKNLIGKDVKAEKGRNLEGDCPYLLTVEIRRNS